MKGSIRFWWRIKGSYRRSPGEKIQAKKRNMGALCRINTVDYQGDENSIEGGGPMNLLREIEKYEPYNEQESRDKNVMLGFLKNQKNVLTRENEIAHFTASAWVLNEARDKVLMIYHNIYDSWSWTGGHADGEENLLAVAIKEVKEETGLIEVRPIQTEIFSLEILTVEGHLKNEKYVPSHLHINCTYLLEASDDEKLSVKFDENQGVCWMDIETCVKVSKEPSMQKIYKKLNEKLRRYQLQNRKPSKKSNDSKDIICVDCF